MKRIRFSVTGTIHSSLRQDVISLIERKIPLAVFDSCPSSVDGLFVEFKVLNEADLDVVVHHAKSIVPEIANIYARTILTNMNDSVRIDVQIRGDSEIEDARLFFQELSLGNSRDFLDRALAMAPDHP